MLSQKVILIVGAMKSGTTSLYSDLSVHPFISAPDLKEPYILVSEKNAKTAEKAYKRHFANAQNASVLLDASTGYAMLPEYTGSAELAKKIFDQPPYIIYMIRDPFGRIISHFRHSVGGGDMVGDFKRALNEDFRLVSYSSYASQISPWVEEFGAGQVNVLTMDYWKEHRAEYASTVYSDLGLENCSLTHGFTGKANCAERARFSPAISKMIRKSLGPKGTQMVYKFVPPFARHFVARLLVKPQKPIDADFNESTFEYVWNKLGNEMRDVRKFIKHPVENEDTIWSKEKLFQTYVSSARS